MGGKPLLNVLIFGANGQVGKALQKEYNNKNIRLTALSKDKCDITNPSLVNEYISKENYDCIINASAYTNVNQAERNKNLSEKINCDALKNICSAISKSKTLLIHYSTDYVFDGASTRAYLEDDKRNPVNQYGLSKFHGEDILINAEVNYLIFRTSWVYDNSSNNFPNKIIEKVKAKEILKIVDDQIGTPNHVDFIANTTFECLEKYYTFSEAKRKKVHGIYHMSSQGQTSWFEFAKFITHYYILKIDLDCKLKIIPIKTSNEGNNIKRPSFSVLDSTKICSTFDIRLPTWQDGACNFIKSKI